MNQPLQRIALSTGVKLDVWQGGNPSDPAVILLHGFPESHRTWRAIAPDLARDHFVVAPDQRGYAGSSKPEGIGHYAPDRLVADVVALADALAIECFTLVGHDWGGAVAWLTALQHPERVAELVIVNAPHPHIYQKSLIEDEAQQRASQYILGYRDPGFERDLAGERLNDFFDATFSRHAILDRAEAGRQAYLSEWAQPGALTAMLSWYRATSLIVPAPGEQVARPASLDKPFPTVRQRTLVIWGVDDRALLPLQIEGLGALVADLSVARVDAGHFVTWEDPAAVIDAMRAWSI